MKELERHLSDQQREFLLGVTMACKIVGNSNVQHYGAYLRVMDQVTKSKLFSDHEIELLTPWIREKFFGKLTGRPFF